MRDPHVFRCVLVVAMICGVAPAGLLAQAGDQRWADAVTPGPGVRLPRVIKEVKPRYTAAAMGAKIEGPVLLECVVETDGTVRRVRIARSLDTAFGLDDAAIDALKQWQFQAGTRNGQPVPVRVTVELSFVLRDSAPATVPLALPQAFRTSPGQRPGDADWERVTITAAPLTVDIAHPKGWRVLSAGPEFTFLAQAPQARLGAFMLRPLATSVVLEPGTMADLREAGTIVAANFKRPLVAVGQVRVAGRLWVWFDLGVAGPAAAAVPGVAARALPDRSRLWAFSTIVEGQQLLLCFVIGHPDGTSKDWEAEAQRVGPTFAGILERIAPKSAK